MKKFTAELDINANNSLKTLGQLEDEATRLNDELKKATLGSDNFNELKKQLIGVNKQIKNTELSLEALDSEQVAGEIGGVAGAVGDVTGAFILLGGDDGPVAETAHRIETAIGVTMAFKGAIEGIQSGMKLFNNIVKTNSIFIRANNVVTKIAAAIQKAFTGSVNTTSVAFRGLKTAIAATGIGLLIIGIGEAVSAIMELTSATDDASIAQEELDKKLQNINKSLQKTAELTSDYRNKLDLATKKEILNAKLRGASEKELRKIQEDGIQKHIDLLQYESSESSKAYTKALNDFTTSNEELDLLAADSSKKFFELQNAIRNFELLQLENRVTDKEAYNAKMKELEDKRVSEELDALKLINDKRNAVIIDQDDFEVKSTQNKFSVLGQLNADYYAKKKEQMDKDFNNEVAIMNAKHQLQNEFVNAASSALGSIAQIAGEGTKVAKAAALADIIMKTGVGFVQGLDIAQKSAAGTGPAAAFAFPIFYATQIAAVLAAVAQAKNILTKVKGGGTDISLPTAPSLGGAESQAPAFNVVGQSGFNQIAGALGQQQPVQAYVVAGDVTTAQQLDNNIITTATF